MTWSTWNWINVLLIFANGYLAYDFLRYGRWALGYGNLIASAMNAASVAVRLGL